VLQKPGFEEGVNKTRFLHTADWQLGLRRHFLGEEALPRYRQARIDAIRTMAALARDRECEFAVVCGDVFESNQIDAQTLTRTAAALGDFPCPVFLLPGNHDPLDAGSIYRSARLRDHPRARVLETSEPVEVRPGLEVVGVPWHTRRPGRDLVAEACAALAPAAPGTLRVCVAHGNTGVAGEHDDPALIRLADAEQALAAGKIHYLALGDRHSVTKIHDRIWYSGSPEPTSYRETEPGYVLVVELDEGACDVQRHAVARWRFVERSFSLTGEADLATLAEWIDGLPDKDRTVLKLRLRGALGLADRAALEARLADAGTLFAAVERRTQDLLSAPGEDDFTALDLSGFARDALDVLTRLAQGQDAQAPVARDALALLYRLVQGEAR